MHIDDFAPNLSFFFSNGMDPEYTVMGRVARRIWAVAMREKYGANERSQKLKYHVQTSGRSLHAQEIQFNDIRTTLQALIAIYDNCNSLHTNAFDEAITTPTEDSVRRAMAIQLIINREWGLAKNENPNQGAFIIDELTELVEEAVLAEFERIAERGGVLGAMETGYQRGQIQERVDALRDAQAHRRATRSSASTPSATRTATRCPTTLELARSTDEEKQSQLQAAAPTSTRATPPRRRRCSQRLQQAVIDNRNVFEVLMDAVRVLLARARSPTRCSRSAGSTGAACEGTLPCRPPATSRSSIRPRRAPRGALVLLEELGADYELHVLEHEGGRAAPARLPGDQPDGQGAGDPARRRDGHRAGRGLHLPRRPLSRSAAWRRRIGDPLRGPYLRWMVVLRLVLRAGAGRPRRCSASRRRRRPRPTATTTRCWRRSTDQLARGPYLLGERFTAADVLWGTALPGPRCSSSCRSCREIMAYMERVNARPAVGTGARHRRASSPRRGRPEGGAQGSSLRSRIGSDRRLRTRILIISTPTENAIAK